MIRQKLIDGNRPIPGKLYRLKKEIISKAKPVNIFEMRERNLSLEECQVAEEADKWIFVWVTELNEFETKNFVIMCIDTIWTTLGVIGAVKYRIHVFLWGNKKIVFGNSLVNNHWSDCLELIETTGKKS